MRNDPFAKLGALDQQLFSGTDSSKPVTPGASKESAQPEVELPQSQGTKQPLDQGFKEARLQGRLEKTSQGPRAAPPKSPEHPKDDLDLSERPERQNTYAFTAEELERLEDLKIEISRKFDLRVTKYDLVRCAVHMLLYDYRNKGEGSDVLHRLRRKKA